MEGQLILNADDFGMTKGVTEGIVQCSQSGLLMSTSAMPCMNSSESMIRAYAASFTGGIGLHLQLTQGIPASNPEYIWSLLNEEKKFPSPRPQMGAKKSEILIEWRAQLERVRSWGIDVDHIDAHHDVHARPEEYPEVYEAYETFAAETGIPARGGSRQLSSRLKQAGVLCPDVTIHFSDMDGGLDALLAVLKKEQKEGPTDICVEVAFHPGIVDDELIQLARPQYRESRERELKLFSDASTREALAAAGWRFGSYKSFL